MIAVGLFSLKLEAQQGRDEQDHSRFLEELNERDFEALRDYLRQKREEAMAKGKQPDLTFSGDIRFEYRNIHEDEIGKRLRGGKHGKKCVDGKRIGLPISNNDFDIEFNLRMDYLGECTWAVARVQYDDSAGVDDSDLDCRINPAGYHGSGACDDLCLKMAYWGAHLYKHECEKFDIELGRRNLYNVFDSRIQFLSRYDGLALRYNNCRDWLGNWYWYFGAFVVDERVNHFAWLTEVGFINILKSGFDLKYSIIDWQKRGENRCGFRNPPAFKFVNSQVSAAYNFNAEVIRRKAKIFGAFVYNHLGQKVTWFKWKDENRVCPGSPYVRTKKGRWKLSDDVIAKTAKNQNKAWYVGALIGEVDKEGDWSAEVRYEWVQAFAIPDDDISGIGRGNCLDDQITAAGGRGNGNYKGWHFEALYAITDNLTIDAQFEFSQALNKSIGGNHHFHKFEVETIYAF